jgi:hypothetical protein
MTFELIFELTFVNAFELKGNIVLWEYKMNVTA